MLSTDATRFPVLDPTSAADEKVGQFEITSERERSALEDAQKRRPLEEGDRLTVRPIDPATGRITSLHYAHTRQRPDSKYEAYCQCGWIGPPRDAKTTAVNDGYRHELRARGPGPYA